MGSVGHGELGMIVYLCIARCTRYYVIFSQLERPSFLSFTKLVDDALYGADAAGAAICVANDPDADRLAAVRRCRLTPPSG